MKPTKLVMCGFGSYGDKTEIDFTLLGKNGLYLITGDTGSGKTTIFDAISFALYGEPSGEMRETKMLRSKYAADSPTYAELWFTYGNDEYYVRRNPEYFRPKAKGQGLTLQRAEAEFKYPDGRLVTGSKEVTKAICSVIGVDKERFAKIAMLAQGEFLKLLSASTDEKTEIFRRLFNTQKYDELRIRLKKEAADRKNIYDNLCAQVKYAVSSAKCEALKPIEASECIDAAVAEEAQKILSDEIAALKGEAKLVESKLAESEKEKQALHRRITLAKEARRLKTAIDENQSLALKCADEISKLKAAAEKANGEEAKKALQALTAEYVAVENNMEKYSRADELALKIQKRHSEILSATNAKEECERKMLLAQKQRAEYGEKLEKLKFIGEEKLSLQGHKEKLCREIAQEEEIIRDREEYRQITAIAKRRREDYLAAKENANLLAQHYIALNNALSDARAGLLAKELKTGEPCPVCGSIEHPCVAEMPKSAPEKEEVEKARSEMEKSRKLSDEAALLAGEAASRVEMKKSEIERKSRDAVAEIDEATAPDYLRKLKDELARVDKKIQDAQRASLLREKIEREIPSLDELVTKLSEEKLVREKEIIRLTQEKISREEEEKRLMAELKYKNQHEAEKAAAQIRHKKQSLEEEMERTQNSLKEAHARITALGSATEALKKQLAAIGETQTEACLQELYLAANEKSQESTSRRDELTFTVRQYAFAAEKLEGMDEKIAFAAKSYAEVKKMADTAAGDIPGKEKIRLEAYVQQAFFERIIHRANVRLMVMTKGKYELKRSLEAENLSGKSGLDLSVTDHYNASERSTKSLSGGESFMAALALALGLSDEIQSSCGGIRLESMFVDEGFGTLDSAALEGAVKVLSELTQGNRIVGVISHVEKLKESIENKIVVTKDKFGKSSAKIYHG